MDKNYYSDRTQSKFIINTLCQKDSLLYKYYEKGDTKRFRKRFTNIGGDQKDIDTVVFVFVTDTLRDIILDIVGELNKKVRPMGDIIVTGGEAFNTYFDRGDRLITSDIDVKFAPIFKLKSGTVISSRDPRFFEYLQLAKLLIYDSLGSYAKKIEKRVKTRIDKLKTSKVGKILGISLPTKKPYVTRRYSLIPKKRHQLNKNTVAPKNILIDVEILALDMDIRYFNSVKQKIMVHPLGGILDVAIMRPYEFGYDVVSSRIQGYSYVNHDTGKIKYNKNILIAGKRFLVDDLYIMKSLGLRPLKVKKDRQRLVDFSKKILGIKNISNSDSDENIHAKAIKLLSPVRSPKVSTRPYYMTNKFISDIKKIDPQKYTKYTSLRWKPVVVERILIGVRAPKNTKIKNFHETSGQYRFNINTHKWVNNTRNSYIKNEYTHRPNLGTYTNKIPTVYNAKTILYGYNPRRNQLMNKELIEKSAILAINGLKNMSFLNFKK